MDDKDIYQAVEKNYHYFLTWREKLFLGYFAALAGLGWASSGLWTAGKHFLFLLPLAAFWITFILLLLEIRNRDLYRTCVKVGHELEKDIEPDKNERGIYTRFDTPIKGISHSNALDLFFFVNFIIFLAMSCYLFKLFTWPKILNG